MISINDIELARQRIAGEILQGLNKPAECSQFGKGCTPDHPLGAPMVSSEGACAAYHRYGRPVVVDRPDPVPGRDEAVIRVSLAGMRNQKVDQS